MSFQGKASKICFSEMMIVMVFLNRVFYISSIKKGGFMKSREYIKAEENFKIEQEKRYLRKDKRAQVEGLTTIKKDKEAKVAKEKK
jgi:hypothetical protein